VTLVLNGVRDTVYAESGSVIKNNPYIDCLIYLKRGAQCDGPASVVIHDTVTSFGLADTVLLECAGLQFDYSDAPPNAAFHQSVNRTLSSAHVQITPNPTNGVIRLTGMPNNVDEASLVNVLGEVVLRVARPISSHGSIDLSNLPAGSYYLRFSTKDGVQTLRVVKQ